MPFDVISYVLARRAISRASSISEDLAQHKQASPIDHPDGSVTDSKIKDVSLSKVIIDTDKDWKSKNILNVNNIEVYAVKPNPNIGMFRFSGAFSPFPLALIGNNIAFTTPYKVEEYDPSTGTWNDVTANKDWSPLTDMRLDTYLASGVTSPDGSETDWRVRFYFDQGAKWKYINLVILYLQHTSYIKEMILEASSVSDFSSDVVTIASWTGKQPSGDGVLVFPTSASVGARQYVRLTLTISTTNTVNDIKIRQIVLAGIVPPASGFESLLPFKWDASKNIDLQGNLKMQGTTVLDTTRKLQNVDMSLLVDGSTINYNTTTGKLEVGKVPYSKLDTSNTPLDGQVLRYNASLDQMEWVDPPSGGGLTTLALDDTELSTTSTTSTELKYARFVKDSTRNAGWNTLYVFVEAYIDTAGETLTIEVYIDSETTPRATISVTANSYTLYGATIDISDLADGLHTVSIRAYVSAGTGYLKFTGVFASQ